jgi:hypothetical protein
MDEVGEERVDELVERIGVQKWGIHISDKRVSAHEKIGLARRHALPLLARDVERSMGKPARNIGEATIRRVLAPIIDAPETDLPGDIPRAATASTEALS